jgi:sec-independent protein translocase protein TatA
MPDIGPLELILLLAIALLVLGPGKLPEVGKAVGQGIREFRKASTDVRDAVRLDAPPPAPQPASAAAPVAPALVAEAPASSPPPAAALPAEPVPGKGSGSGIGGGPASA